MFGFLFKTFVALQHLTGWAFTKPVQNGRPVILYTPEVVAHVINYVDIEFPIVLLHGLGGSAEKMSPLCDWLEQTFRRKVYNLEIGNGEQTSLYMPLPTQLTELCKTIYSIPELQNGFDFIGMSQGGLLARGYVEQCNRFPVRNLITLVTPHGGVFFGGDTGNMYTDFKHL